MSTAAITSGKQWTSRGTGYHEIETLAYPAFPASPRSAWLDTALGAPVPEKLASPTPTAQSIEDVVAQFERRIAEETRQSFEAGRERGRQEGIQAEREAQVAIRTREEKQRAEQIAALVQKLDDERERYLHTVEHEVVDLALAIAARILRREAQMDPLLLTGAVRVALGQLANTTKVRLVVPPAEHNMWTEAIEHLPSLAVKPTVLPGDGMRVGDCVIETELGSVDLGIRSQLGEIERGFFDRTGRDQDGSADQIQTKAVDRGIGR